LTKKTKIANKEEDSFISDGQYGFKGSKKKKYGYDITLDDYDANVLELENDDPRETVLDDDKKDKEKKSKTNNSKQEVKTPAVVNPEGHESKKVNEEDKKKVDEKQTAKEEVKPALIESKNPNPPAQEQVEQKDKEEQKDKLKEKEKQDHEEEKNKEESKKEKKLHHEVHKDKHTHHGGGGINKPKPKEVKVPGTQEQKDTKDENDGTVEKIAVNKDSSDGYVNSLNQVHPIQFIDEVKHSPTTGHQLEEKESKKEHEKLPEIEQPTGLPLKGSEKLDKTKEKSNPKDIKLQPEGPKKFSLFVNEKHEQPLAPLPLPTIPYVNKETGDATAIKNVLHTFPTSDPNLNSDFGPVPEINLDGQADPEQNEKFHTEASDQTNEEKAKADVEITKDYGENNIYPSVETEKLKTDYQFNQPPDISSLVNQDTSAFDEATKAQFDEKALNKLQQDREQEIQKVMDGKEQKDQKIEKEHKVHHEKIEKETLKVKKDQEKEQDLAKKSVDKHRQDWETENQKVKSDFDTESDKKKKETKASIDEQVQKTDSDIKSQVNDANKQVKDKTDEAERKAKAEKAKADEQPKGFWDSITDAVSDFFDAIKDAINSIFDALRKFVKTVIDKAKKAINALIDYVRDAVIGMIKAFGEALKALVKIALAAFPELRDKFCAFIDKAVDTACDAVNKLAEGLKKAVNFLLDALGKAIDMVLAFYQKLVNLALTALQMLAVGLLKVLKFLSQIGEKLKKFGALIDSINEIYHHPEILEQAAQQTIQPYIDKIPAETAAKLNEGLSAVGLTKHFKGIWKYLGPALSHLASNWWGEAKKMVWYLIWPFAEGSPLYEDAPKLVSLVPQIWKDVWAGEYSKAIDGCLEWMQALNMTLGAFSGWMAIAGIVVGAVIGGVVGAVGGAGVGAIPGAVAGAGAGLELAAAVGEGLMVSMMATEAAVLTKAIYDLMNTEDDENKESTPAAPATPPNENNNSSETKHEGPQGGSEEPPKHYTSGTVKSGHDRIQYAYQRIANSVITLGIMGALFLLGAIGGKIAQGLASAFKKLAAALDRVAPETMAGIRNAMSKVSSGAGKFTKPFKDLNEKYGGDFNKGREWMKGKIDNVKGKFGFKKKGKGGKEEENNNNNQDENKDNQNNKDENKDQNNNENNEQNQNNSEQKDEVDTNSKEENNSNKNEESNSENKDEVDPNENANSSDNPNGKVEEKTVEETPVDNAEPTGKDAEPNEVKDAPLSNDGPYSKLPDNVKRSVDKLKDAGLKVVEEGNVIKILSKDGKLLAEIEEGVLKFKYKGFGGDVVMDPDKTTTVLGKFFEDIHDPDKGTRYFLGTDKEPLPVEGLPEGTFSRGEGKGSNNNGMNFLDIKEADYNALMDKNIQKYLDKGFPKDEAERLGRIDGNAEFWNTYNEPFLEDAFKRGDNVRLVSDPKTQRTGTYARELDAIEKPGGLAEKYGYKFDEATNTWRKDPTLNEAPKIEESSTVDVESPESKFDQNPKGKDEPVNNNPEVKDSDVPSPTENETTVGNKEKVEEPVTNKNEEVTPKEETKEPVTSNEPVVEGSVKGKDVYETQKIDWTKKEITDLKPEVQELIRKYENGEIKFTDLPKEAQKALFAQKILISPKAFLEIFTSDNSTIKPEFGKGYIHDAELKLVKVEGAGKGMQTGKYELTLKDSAGNNVSVKIEMEPKASLELSDPHAGDGGPARFELKYEGDKWVAKVEIDGRLSEKADIGQVFKHEMDEIADIVHENNPATSVSKKTPEGIGKQSEASVFKQDSTSLDLTSHDKAALRELKSQMDRTKGPNGKVNFDDPQLKRMLDNMGLSEIKDPARLEQLYKLLRENGISEPEKLFSQSVHKEYQSASAGKANAETVTEDTVEHLRFGDEKQNLKDGDFERSGLSGGHEDSYIQVLNNDPNNPYYFVKDGEITLPNGDKSIRYKQYKVSGSKTKAGVAKPGESGFNPDQWVEAQVPKTTVGEMGAYLKEIPDIMSELQKQEGLSLKDIYDKSVDRNSQLPGKFRVVYKGVQFEGFLTEDLKVRTIYIDGYGNGYK
jgi:hypothetical protein